MSVPPSCQHVVRSSIGYSQGFTPGSGPGIRKINGRSLADNQNLWDVVMGNAPPECRDSVRAFAERYPDATCIEGVHFNPDGSVTVEFIA